MFKCRPQVRDFPPRKQYSTVWEDFEMIKKFAAMLLTGVMAISLAACGGSSGATTSTDNWLKNFASVAAGL